MIVSLLQRHSAARSLSVQTWKLFCQASTSQPSDSNVVEVCTTGYSFSTASGRVAKYGIYWGPGDPRNVICELPGKTHVAAMLTALIEAVRVARRDDSLEKLVLYTDFNCPPAFQSKLKVYASRDFHSYLGPKMKNADLLRDLYESAKHMNVVFRHRLAVEDKKPNYVIANILEGKSYTLKTCPSEEPPTDFHCEFGVELQANGEKPATSSEGWPCVYTTGLYKASKNGFKSASYAVVWSDKRHGNDTMRRLAMVPVTLFRAQLAAIEEALKQAVDNRLTRVVVITDSAMFMSNWRKGWVRYNGAPASNKFLFDRIRDLTESGVEVRFRYENPQKSSLEWSSVIDKCTEAIDLPMVGKDRSEYSKSLADILLHEDSVDSPVAHRVTIFKRSPSSASKVVWEGEGADSSAESERKTHHALLAVLEKASDLAFRQLIIRTDSTRLIMASENWLPVWQRNGWRNSLHKPIADVDCWRKIWSLKKIIKVYWELMDSPDHGDKAVIQFESV